MKLLFRKSIVLALLAALGVAVMPFASVSAAGEVDLSVPPQREVSNEKLERIWARQLGAYEKIGNHFERADAFIEKVLQLIDRAEENGKDVSAVQTALDAFEAAIKDAQPIYESANGIIDSHQGFDDNGKVTNPEEAKETIQAMGEKLKEIRAAMNGTGKALIEAIKAFREANPRPQPTPTPDSTS